MVNTEFSFLLFGDKDIIKKVISDIWDENKGMTFKKYFQETTAQTMKIFDSAVLFETEFSASIKFKKLMEKYSKKNKLSLYYSAVIEDGPSFHYWFIDNTNDSKIYMSFGNHQSNNLVETDLSKLGVDNIYKDYLCSYKDLSFIEIKKNNAQLKQDIEIEENKLLFKDNEFSITDGW